MITFRISCVFGVLASIAFEALADKPVLTVYTYDSFTSDWGPGPLVESKFEEICDCDLQFVGLDSSIGILGRIQLEGDATKADIALGLDTNLVHLAKKTGYFTPLSSEIRQINNATNNLPISYDDDVFMPFDWGWFGFVYKKDVLVEPPTSFDELLDMSNDIKIVIQDPRTSTPGLGLLLWIKSVYGDDAADYWKALQPKILTVTKGWSEAVRKVPVPSDRECQREIVGCWTSMPATMLQAELQ
jgi:thiamine transport system substrate-binding protein